MLPSIEFIEEKVLNDFEHNAFFELFRYSWDVHGIRGWIGGIV
jgi:hypothetical protein